MRKRILPVIFLLIFQACWGFADIGKSGQSGAQPASQKPATDEKTEEAAEERLSVTNHSITIQGEKLGYTATAGRLPLKDGAGKHKADVFFTAYVKDPQDSARKRPVSFVFNGGPGASSVWLHLGAIGPKRVITEDSSAPLPPPYKLVENAYSWLAFTDLVFIDPVGTGFSRPAQGESAKQFYGVQEDLEWVGNFIRLYTSRYDRWPSPKFLVGESYGTFRAIGLADYLYDTYGMDFNGLVLISLAIDFQTFSFGPANDLPYAIFLPTYTASAWYHEKLAPELQENLLEAIKESEEWAMSDYFIALAQGDWLSGEERDKVVQNLMHYTGLSKQFIENNNLRIERSDFANEILRAENLSPGLLDSRTTRTGQTVDFLKDPSVAVTVGPYVATLNDYVRNALKYETDTPYVFLSEEVNGQWDWGSGIRGYVNILGPLRKAMTRNRYLMVMAAGGYYDLNTPCMGAKYSLGHLGLEPALQKNITIGCYEAGHMLYTHTPSLEKLTSDVSAFMKNAIPSDAKPGN